MQRSICIPNQYMWILIVYILNDVFRWVYAKTLWGLSWAIIKPLIPVEWTSPYRWSTSRRAFGLPTQFVWCAISTHTHARALSHTNKLLMINSQYFRWNKSDHLMESIQHTIYSKQHIQRPPEYWMLLLLLHRHDTWNVRSVAKLQMRLNLFILFVNYQIFRIAGSH